MDKLARLLLLFMCPLWVLAAFVWLLLFPIGFLYMYVWKGKTAYLMDHWKWEFERLEDRVSAPIRALAELEDK